MHNTQKWDICVKPIENKLNLCYDMYKLRESNTANTTPATLQTAKAQQTQIVDSQRNLLQV